MSIHQPLQTGYSYEYRIISAITVTDLNIAVNKMISSGWFLAGNAFTLGNGEVAQPMQRKDVK